MSDGILHEQTIIWRDFCISGARCRHICPYTNQDLASFEPDHIELFGQTTQSSQSSQLNKYLRMFLTWMFTVESVKLVYRFYERVQEMKSILYYSLQTKNCWPETKTL